MTSDPAGTAAAGAAPAHREWAHLRLIEEIGRGGFGRVYRAWDTALAREVALKLVRVSEAHSREASSLVLEEGRMLARVRHPNVVTVYGALQIGNEVGLWMELVRGRSLADVVRTDGPRGAEEAAVIGLAVCRALAAVHAAGLVHRDVKAHNVMRESGGRIVLMDFGAGRDASIVEPAGWGAPGTPAYMAPEVIAGEPATRASDIYSVGVLLYFLVTGRHPFEGRTLMEIAIGHGSGRRRLLADDRPDLPDRFIRIVERALAPNPADRFPSAGALVHELSDMLPGMRRSGMDEERLETPQSTDSPAARLAREPTPGRSDPELATPGVFASEGPAGRPRSPWVRRAGIAAACLAGVPWLLGLLTSLAFNNSLARPASFSGDSVWGWWAWGARALIPPIVYMTAGLLAFLLMRSIWRLTRQLVRPFDRWCRNAGNRMNALLRRSGLDDPSNPAQLLILAQTLAIAAILWRFWPVFVAQYAIITHADPAILEPLHRAHAYEVERTMYGLAVDALVLGAGAAWAALIRARRRRGLPRLDASAAAGVALLALAFLAMWVVPYRVTWFNEFQRAEYAGERCYVIGEREDDVLLYCPDVPAPRNRRVRATEVQRLDVIESIFVPRRDARPAGR
ncbi:MAG TPA: serine/threonine-protein kinase [Vicinamibacterales bacterium]|nr:serine/threonine-protein kinase [Vicinamibacterales bacterium]